MFWIEQFINLHPADIAFISLIVLLLVVTWLSFKKYRQKGRRYWAVMGLGYCTGAAVLFYSLFIEPNLLVHRSYRFDAPGVELTEPLRLVVIGDMQYRAHIAPSYVRHVVNQVNKTSPDYVIWVGDLIEHRLDFLDLFLQFEDIYAKYEKIAVLGNHDYRLSMVDPVNFQISDQVTTVFEAAGFNVLNNDSLVSSVNDVKLNFVGTPDLWSEPVEQQMLNAITTVNQADVNIYVTHQPMTILENQSPEIYDIILAGHCHGGQISLGWFDRLVGLPHVPDGCFDSPDYAKGLFRREGTNFLVTPGVGSMYLRMRFLVPPEISILEVY